MSNEKRNAGFPVDEHGEIFQADLTDEEIPSPSERAGHGTSFAGEDVDSRAGDDFMREQKFRRVTRGSIEKHRAPQSVVGVLGSLPKDVIRSLENAGIEVE